MRADLVVTAPLYSELGRALCSAGLPVFGVAGDSNLLFVDSFVRGKGRYVPATHEGAAVLMAAGFASTSRDIGVATITQGALTNAVTGLVFAARSRLPVVLLAGETPDWDTDNVQAIGTRALVAAAESDYLRVDAASDAATVLALAFTRAGRDRVPVVVGIPTDVMHAETEGVSIPAARPEVVEPSDAAVRRVADLLVTAQRPLIVAGRGVVEEGVEDELLMLARQTGARLATTLRAKNLFEGEVENLGIIGGLESSSSAPFLDAADLVLAFGASLNSYTTSQGAALEGRVVVQIDRNPAARRTDSFVVGSAGKTARRLQDAAGPGTRRQAWTIESPSTSDIGAESAEATAEGTVDYATVLDALESLLPADRLLTVDGGRTFFEGVRRLTVQHPADYIHTMSTGSIGLGIALATGAWCSARDDDRLSVLVTGDGGLMLGGLSEFNTAVRIGARLLVIVMNDGCYGAEHHQLTRHGLAPDISYFAWPDFAPVAESLGGVGLAVRSIADLEAVATAINGDDWPVLVDVALDPEKVHMDFIRTRPD